MVPGDGGGFGEGAHAQDVALALGDGDGAAGVQQVEGVRGFQRLFVGGQRQPGFCQLQRHFFGGFELGKEAVHVGVFEVVGGLLAFVLVIDVAVADDALRRGRPDEVVNAIDVLQVHGDALQAVGQLAHDGFAFQPARLLEVGELRDFHAVYPHFPAQSPGAEGRRFPVVLDEAHVVYRRVNADGAHGFQIQILKARRRWLHDDLELVVALQAVGVVAVTAVGGAARRLHIGGIPRLRADGVEEGGGVEGARAHFHIIGLHDDAALLRPEALQGENHLLKIQYFSHNGILIWEKGGIVAPRRGACQTDKADALKIAA